MSPVTPPYNETSLLQAVSGKSHPEAEASLLDFPLLQAEQKVPKREAQ